MPLAVQPGALSRGPSAARRPRQLLAEVLLEVFPFLPPAWHGVLSRVSRRWAEASRLAYRRFLAWRRMGDCAFLACTSPPRSRTAYHLREGNCWMVTRESGFFSEGAVRISRTRLFSPRSRQSPAAEQSAPDPAMPPPAPVVSEGEGAAEGAATPLLSLGRTTFCHIEAELLLIIATEAVEVYSLDSGLLMRTLRPLPEQRRLGVQFTAIVCCGGRPGEGGGRRVVCKMRPAPGAPQSACVNVYDLSTGACVAVCCGLRKVRACHASARFAVMKGVAGSTAEVMAIDVASGTRRSNKHALFAPPAQPEGAAVVGRARGDMSLVGVDMQEVAYFVQPVSVKELPGAWRRWCARLSRRRSQPMLLGVTDDDGTAEATSANTFQFVSWDVVSNVVQRHSLAVDNLPAPYGWPANRPFTLVLEKDKCLLADQHSVLICFFSRSVDARSHVSGDRGIVGVYTKTGHLLSVIDPTRPSVRRAVFAEPPARPAGEDAPDWNAAEEGDCTVDVLSTDAHCPSVLLSMTVNAPQRQDPAPGAAAAGPASVTKVFSQSFPAVRPCAPPGFF
eukprot:TRINITY_DN7302_c0_g1_i1.p1 TRINITY_DN7302_c0_g1~~TRINITY_DN7302_c0_g1_i1.p1  ORF type:complete len:590 (+),score=102.14 TRINITY_DN7302_c0_g1_i1:88-1770(+)